MQNILEQSVLVLDNSFLAIQVWNVKDALCALLLEKVSVVNENYETFTFQEWLDYSNSLQDLEENKCVHSPSITMLAPQIIRIQQYKGRAYRPDHVKFSRSNVCKRDNGMCQYCGKQDTQQNLTLDHVIPKSRGGKNEWENIVACCKKCNAKKGDKLLSELGWQLIQIPKKPKWKTHIGSNFDVNKRKCWENFLK